MRRHYILNRFPVSLKPGQNKELNLPDSINPMEAEFMIESNPQIPNVNLQVTLFSATNPIISQSVPLYKQYENFDFSRLCKDTNQMYNVVHILSTREVNLAISVYIDFNE